MIALTKLQGSSTILNKGMSIYNKKWRRNILEIFSGHMIICFWEQQLDSADAPNADQKCEVFSRSSRVKMVGAVLKPNEHRFVRSRPRRIPPIDVFVIAPQHHERRYSETLASSYYGF
jgi:hypothetical protein